MIRLDKFSKIEKSKNSRTSKPAIFHEDSFIQKEWPPTSGKERTISRCSRVVGYIYLDRKFGVCHAGEFGGRETRRMEQGATRSEGHVP